MYKSYSLLVLFASFLVLYEDSIELNFLFILLLAFNDDDDFSILSWSSVDVETDDDVENVEFDGIVTDTDVEGTNSITFRCSRIESGKNSMTL